MVNHECPAKRRGRFFSGLSRDSFQEDLPTREAVFPSSAFLLPCWQTVSVWEVLSINEQNNSTD